MSEDPLDDRGEDSPTLTRPEGDRPTAGLSNGPGGVLAPGRRFGPYLIHRLLGRGGMAQT